MSCPKCPHCARVETARKYRQFNKEHPGWEIDSYHQILFNDGGVVENAPSIYKYDTVDDFIKACEQFIKQEAQK